MIELTSHVSGGTLYFYANTHSAAGVATDADSVPSYRLYVQENGTAVATGTMAKLDDANTTGFYSEAVAMAGYDPGEYVCYISATVGGVVATKSFPFVVGIGSGPLLVRTTIATLGSQTSFTLTGGPVEDDAINDSLVIVRDAASVDQFCVGYVDDYAGSTKTVTLAANPGIFTMAVGDSVEVYAPIAANLVALRSSKQSAVDLKDFADDGYDPATNKVQGVVLTDTLTTYTGNTLQTGDTYTLASTEIADIKAKTDALPSDPADASDIAAAFGTVNSTLGTIAAYVDTEVAAIKAKTDQLTFTVANRVDSTTQGGLASQASVDDVPTNAELATALGTADDATLAAIAALNNLSQANVRTAVGLGSANLDTQLGDLPTNAELATALGTADDATLVAIGALNNLSQANVRTAVGLAAGNLDTQLLPLAKVDTALELDGAVYRYTTNALEQAPSGAGATDWTTDEQEQIRYRLGLDGTATEPATGIPSLATQQSVDDVQGDLATVSTMATALVALVGTPATATLSTDLAAIQDDANAIRTLVDVSPEGFQRNTAYPDFVFHMVQTADGVTPATGLTITAERRLDNAAYTPCTNAATELSEGDYTLDLDATDLGAVHFVTFRMSAAGARTLEFTVKLSD